MKIALMDINGNLEQEVKEDELKFGLKITPVPEDGLMGFHIFEISGDRVQEYLDYYEIESF